MLFEKKNLMAYYALELYSLQSLDFGPDYVNVLRNFLGNVYSDICN